MADIRQRQKRPGGALEDLIRRTIHLSAAREQNWLPGDEPPPMNFPVTTSTTPEHGREEFQNFIDKIVGAGNPELAKRWKRQAGLTAPSTNEADRTYSNPNVTF